MNSMIIFIYLLLTACMGSLFLVGTNQMFGQFIADRQKVITALSRYTLAFACFVLAFLLSSYALIQELDNADYVYLVALLVLGGLFLTDIALLFPNNARVRRIAAALSLLALAGTYYYLSYVFLYHTAVVKLLHYFLLTVALLFTSPFSFNKHSTVLWNRWIFILSALFIAAFYAFAAGLAISAIFVSVDYLFDIFKHHSLNAYWTLWFFMSMVFAPTLALTYLSDIDNSSPAPAQGLVYRLLSRSVLIPFVLLYTAVLYVYVIKILWVWTLPKGSVAWLVCSYALIGTIAWLLNWEEAGPAKRLPRFFQRYFHQLLIPLLGLLFVGIYERISAYGVTEVRYYLVILATWITAISIYFITSRSITLKALAPSLAILIFFTSFGPWGASSVALNSQLARLEALFAEVGVNPEVEYSQRRNIAWNKNQAISGVIDYLLATYGAEPLRLLFSGNQRALVALGGDQHDSNLYHQGLIDRKRLLESIGLRC